MDVLAFDIETGAAEELHSYGPGFIRLCGWSGISENDPVHISTDPDELVAAMRQADALTAHNGINFDHLALAVQGYLDQDEYEAMCKKTLDTMLVEKHLNPVVAKNRQPKGYYGLDSTAARRGVGGKASVDFAGKIEMMRRVRGDKPAEAALKARELARRKAEAKGVEFEPEDSFNVLHLLADWYGGFDRIPQDDPDYVHYLELDVRAQRGLYAVHMALLADEPVSSRKYVRREHYTQMTMASSVTYTGVRTDVDLTMKRWSEGQSRLEDGKQLLHEKYGMPTEGKKPHVSNAGKAAFRKAMLSALGCTEQRLEEKWPLAKDGSLLVGKKVLDEFIPIFERTRPDAAELCKVIKAMNGERTVYGTLLDHMVNGYVHPYVGPDQASGRWSMRNPGLTVMGKRGGKARERAVILADNDDEVLCAIDADQVDARVVAAECQDPAYMQLFGPGMDLHSEVAWRVWSSPTQHGPDCVPGFQARCKCERRDQAKVFGHGFSYGLGAKGMSLQHGVPIEVAYSFIQGMTEAFPRLAEWKEEVRQAAGVLAFGDRPPANDSYRVLHTWAGRPVRVEREDAYTQATAMLGQGGTRDVMAEAILRLPRQYRRRVRAVIHDEIVLSLPREGAQDVAQSIADGMAFDLKGVAITFGCSRVSPNWAGCYGEQYETAA